MSTASAFACPECGTTLEFESKLCAACQAALDAIEEVAVDAATWSTKGFRGPRNMAVTGGVTALAGWLLTFYAVSQLPDVSYFGVLGLVFDLISGGEEAVHDAFFFGVLWLVGWLIVFVGGFLVAMAALWSTGRIRKSDKGTAAIGNARAAVTSRTAPAAAEVQRRAAEARPKVEDAARKSVDHVRSTVAPKVGQAAGKGVERVKSDVAPKVGEAASQASKAAAAQGTRALKALRDRRAGGGPSTGA